MPLHRLRKVTAVPFANQAIVLKVHHGLLNCFRVLIDTLILYLTPALFADLRQASHLESIVSIHRSLSSTVSTMTEQQDAQVNIPGTSIFAEYELQALLITSSLSQVLIDVEIFLFVQLQRQQLMEHQNQETEVGCWRNLTR